MITNCCPAATALPTVPSETCAQNFGQIQKIIFQRIMNGSTKNSITDGTSAGNAGLLASWTALKTANDDTKIAVSPFIEAPADDGGDARTYGDGSNDTLNGAGIVIGSNPVGMTFDMNNMPQSVIEQMEGLVCEAMGHNLGVFLVNENGQVRGIKESVTSGGTTTVTWRPIPIQTLFVGEWQPGGLDANDKNALSFKFVPGYLKKTAILTPTNGTFLSL